jgi:hypothetical protein
MRTSLVSKLADLVSGGQLTPDDVIDYANYPGRVLSAEERAELSSLVADVRTLVPAGRTDGVEYVRQVNGTAEYEAQFAAGLARTGSLGFATERDMTKDWEGAYFSVYHPAELNPPLRLFANQLNTGVSLLRPTPQRNESKPMFTTPGIDSDPANTRMKGQLAQMSNQEITYTQSLATAERELARITNPNLRSSVPDAGKVESLRQTIRNLKAAIAAIAIQRRMLYGTQAAYEANAIMGGEPEPALAIAPGGAPAPLGQPPTFDPPLVVPPVTDPQAPATEYPQIAPPDRLGIDRGGETRPPNRNAAFLEGYNRRFNQVRGLLPNQPGAPPFGGDAGGGPSSGDGVNDTRLIMPPPPAQLNFDGNSGNVYDALGRWIDMHGLPDQKETHRLPNATAVDWRDNTTPPLEIEPRGMERTPAAFKPTQPPSIAGANHVAAEVQRQMGNSNVYDPNFQGGFAVLGVDPALTSATGLNISYAVPTESVTDASTAMNLLSGEQQVAMPGHSHDEYAQNMAKMTKWTDSLRAPNPYEIKFDGRPNTTASSAPRLPGDLKASINSNPEDMIRFIGNPKNGMRAKLRNMILRLWASGAMNPAAENAYRSAGLLGNTGPQMINPSNGIRGRGKGRGRGRGAVTVKRRRH